MRINYNVSAAIANKHLLGIEDNLSASMERLSSGLKINHSKDNPAGMAISNKMKAQIDGLISVKSCFLGKYSRRSPLVFSLVPLCHG